MSGPFAIPLIALPIERSTFEGCGFGWLYHLTKLEYLDGIVTSISGRPGMWTDCQIRLVATSGFGAVQRLMRDYSVLDFELKLADRGSYTYFFCGEPSGWGLFKNFTIGTDRPFAEHGFGAVRIRPADLLARYDGPLFYRGDDHALVIRGGYAGPAQVEPLPMNAGARGT